MEPRGPDTGMLGPRTQAQACWDLGPRHRHAGTSDPDTGMLGDLGPRHRYAGTSDPGTGMLGPRTQAQACWDLGMSRLLPGLPSATFKLPSFGMCSPSLCNPSQTSLTTSKLIDVCLPVLWFLREGRYALVCNKT